MKNVVETSEKLFFSNVCDQAVSNSVVVASKFWSASKVGTKHFLYLDFLDISSR